ncbi:heterokaryon incompatibility protein-domain-containing protein, partial [Pyrenochaeta sp. MPI-SDFR-AT-0127]
LRSCHLNHERCFKQSNAAPPTRILDLGKSNEFIKLVETHGFSAPYICLSHCWGESSTIVCTRKTYSDYQNNIPWTSLPLLFQDTVNICRMLGVQYLWIDKLCIIQRDEDDWAREGSKMAQIFGGSFLTIAAAISGNDTNSLFFQAKRQVASLNSYGGQTKDGSSYTIYSRLPFSYHPTDRTSSNPTDKRYTLMTRAWVYQERLLAPRVLYFGEELSWECREASACECSGAGYGIKYDHSLSLVPEFSPRKLHLQWQEIVKDFTWLQLSHEEDRLPAFSGLAQQYQYHLKSAYLAGLWRTNLLADLMWFAYPEYDSSEAHRYSTKRPRKWRAPSWSWASVEGPIVFSEAYHLATAE